MTRPHPPRSYIMHEGSTKRYYVYDVPHAMMRHGDAKKSAADRLRNVVVIVASFVALAVVSFLDP